MTTRTRRVLDTILLALAVVSMAAVLSPALQLVALMFVQRGQR